MKEFLEKIIFFSYLMAYKNEDVFRWSKAETIGMLSFMLLSIYMVFMNIVRHNIFYLMYFVLFIVLFSCNCNSESTRFVFNDNIQNVSDSIRKMDCFMNKFPKTSRVNCFIDNEGFLFLNSKKVAKYQNVLNNKKIRNDEVFISFSDDEYENFFSLYDYLKDNYISTIVLDFTGNFIYSYEHKNIDQDHEFLMYIHTPSDTIGPLFHPYFKVLECNNKLALIRMKGY